MGSGTVGEVCKKMNRDFIGCEINKDYFEIAQNRIMNGISQPSAEKFINSCSLFS
jgi:site-specific DNA-methyltransferase (adenine-specific)